MPENRRALSILGLNTLAFTVCFAAWTMNGVLITFLVENKVITLDHAQIGWLLGLPILSGAITRLPAGMLTDRYGGRFVFPAIMVLAAIPAYLLSYANGYTGLIWASLGFGLAGASFAVGIAYTSVWFKKERQGTALGVFGAGNAGAALTSLGAPRLLNALTDGGADLDAWRLLPRIYAIALVVTALVFLAFTKNRKPERDGKVSLAASLKPLSNMRVWRFGLYYFLVFGGFVALAQWLIPYYVNVYAVSLATAGLLAMMFSLPSGVIRAIGGWLSDLWGARAVMYGILTVTLLASALLVLPPMNIQTPGEGVVATGGGTVTSVSEREITVGEKSYALRAKNTDAGDGVSLFRKVFWHEPAVSVGDQVKRKQLLAKGTTTLYFSAPIWGFTALVFLIGVTTGIGKAAVYKHIAEYFPKDVGVVGGMVGVIGAMGGFVMPIFFGYMLRATGIWSTTWVFFAALTLVCLVWMHMVVAKMMNRRAPSVAHQFDERNGVEAAVAASVR